MSTMNRPMPRPPRPSTMSIRRFMPVACAALLLLLPAAAPSGSLPIASAAAAEAADPADPVRLADIVGTEWKLVSLTIGDEVQETGDAVSITLTVDENGRVSGRSAVNRYFSTLTLGEDGAIEWPGPLGLTRMAGPPHLMQWEARYTGALVKTTRMTKCEGTLVLADEDDGVVLRFTAAADKAE